MGADVPKTRRADTSRPAGATAALKRRAWPVGVALGVTSLAGIIADVVGVSQILVLGGGDSLLWLYPISGLGLALPAILLVPVIDRWPRLVMLRRIGVAMALTYAVALAAALIGQQFAPDSAAPLVAVGVIWIMGAVQNYLYPMLLWSLASDLFNVSESKVINGWIASWSYIGRLLALGLTVITPPLLATAGVPLMWLLAIPAVLTLAMAVWLPLQLRGSNAASGLAVSESIGDSLKNGWHFVHSIPVWRWLMIGSVITFTAGSAVSLGISAASDIVIGKDAGALQMYMGGVQLAAALLCLLIQGRWAVALTKKVGINGTLLVLPVSIVIAGVLLATSLIATNLWLLAMATLLWRVPAWSVDQNARSSALGFVPDQRRARVSLILVLTSFALTRVLCAIPAAPGLLWGPTWLIGALPALVGAAALWWWVQMYRQWDHSMLDWRLRRRKRSGFAALDDW